MITIYGLRGDYHSMAIAIAMRRCGIHCDLIRPQPEDGVEVGSYTRNSRDLVWFRQSRQFLLPETPADLSLYEKSNIHETSAIALHAQMLRLCSEASQIWNNPSVKYDCANRIHQLMIAKSVGMHVPNTLISSNFNNSMLKNVANKDGFVIVKPLRANIWNVGPGRWSIQFTKKVHLSELVMLDRQYHPSIFQMPIEKRSEIRLCVFKNNIVAVEITSNSRFPDDITDWRLDFKANYRVFECSATIKQQVRDYMQEIRCEVGVFDFAIDADGDVWFLEVNPSGQFLFLELAQPSIKMLEFSLKSIMSAIGKDISTVSGVGLGDIHHLVLQALEPSIGDGTHVSEKCNRFCTPLPI